jgi:RimJ/RimL family protein N-acetyltransferase
MKDELADGRIRLRAPHLDDARAHHDAAVESWPEVGRWLAWCHEGYSLDESRSWIEQVVEARKKGDLHEFFIFDMDDRFLGGCGLSRIDKRFLKANLGYWVRTSAIGRGVAAAATRLVARFGFDRVGLQRVEIIAAVDNVASQRVAEKIGATREGILRNGIRFGDRNIDAVGFSLVPGDL